MTAQYPVNTFAGMYRRVMDVFLHPVICALHIGKGWDGHWVFFEKKAQEVDVISLAP
jgi:hypothetical protein